MFDSELGYPGCIPDASSIDDETDGDLSSETRSGSETSDCETPRVGELWPDTDDEAEWYHHEKGETPLVGELWPDTDDEAEWYHHEKGETPLVGELWPDTDDEAEWYHHEKADKAYAAECSSESQAAQAFTIQMLSMLQGVPAKVAHSSSCLATPTGRTSPLPKVSLAQSSRSPRTPVLKPSADHQS